MGKVIEKKCSICRHCRINGDGTFACLADGGETDDDMLEDIIDEPHNCALFECDD